MKKDVEKAKKEILSRIAEKIVGGLKITLTISLF